jgi:hypothetical protein
VYIDSSVSGSTVTGPDVTVTGAVVNSTGAETGVTVNGVLATVIGSRFVANHVPLQSGANTILVSATDVNGLTASASCTVTDTTGYYLRIVPNVTSGTAPLNISFSINSSFLVTNPSMTTTGPAQLTLTAASANQYTGTISFEGTYTVAVSATGPDGLTYSDTLTVTVASKVQMDNLLQGKWAGMRGAMTLMDVQTVTGFFTDESKDRYSGLFTALGNTLPQVAQDIQNISMVYVTDNLAQYRIRLIEEAGLITYYIYFVKDDSDGIWRIPQY